MSNPLRIAIPRLEARSETVQEYVVAHRPLRRVMAFLGCSIDQVCADQIVKNKVFGFWKLQKQIDRSMEITELERQWNRR